MAMVLMKVQCTIKFDIVIPTPKGSVICVYFKRASEVSKVAGKILPVNWH